jgi:GNAT superfamily N-acetyltransferase
VTPECTIELARAEELPRLREIELANNALFAEVDLPGKLRERTTPAGDLAAGQREGRLWVARAAAGVVGFALAEAMEHCVYLDELDVLREHQRRGIGAALVDTVCAWARARGERTVALLTSRFVAWNMPWYERLGFREIPPGALPPELAEILAHDAALGFDPARRVMMARALSADR